MTLISAGHATREHTVSETKKIQPQDPSAIAADEASSDKMAERKTASANARFRKTAMYKAGRKTNSGSCRF